MRRLVRSRAVRHIRAKGQPRRTRLYRIGKRRPEVSVSVNMAMRDLPWGPYLRSEKDAVVKAYEQEITSLLSTVLKEIKPGDPEFEEARRSATRCRAILEIKRQGVFKARVVVRGDTEDKEKLDGPDFNYASDVVGLAAVRAIMFGPRQPGDVVASVDISTAYLQSDLFEPDEPPRYLVLKDPISGQTRYFRQLGVVYGSASSAVRWMNTLHPFLVSIGFQQGKNEPCVFRHPKLGVTIASYVDDLLLTGPEQAVRMVLEVIGERFKCKEPTFLAPGTPLDHLGMVFFETDEGRFVSMQSYIDAMLTRLDMADVKTNGVKVPISQPITDLTPASQEEGKFLLRACGMLGWLAGTVRIDLRYCHSRIAQHMANPTVGAVKAVRQAIRYCASTRELCLWQPKDASGGWTHFSDSDHAGNAEKQNSRRSQLGYVSTYRGTPIGWGSKASAVQFGPPQANPADQSCPSHGHGTTAADKSAVPVCHPKVTDLYPDVSSAAAEIYAASVALSEVLHLSYICDEIGDPMDLPVRIQVDNAAAIAFASDRVRRSKLKHIDVRQEWVQALRDHSVCKLEKVDTKDNLSDLMTKILDMETFEGLRGRMMRSQAVV